MIPKLLHICIFILAINLSSVFGLNLKILKSEENAYEYSLLGHDARESVHGYAGINHPSILPQWSGGNGSNYCENDDDYFCLKWGDYASLTIKQLDSCFRFEWSSDFAREIRDCFDLQEGIHWYGGGMNRHQVWPIQKLPRDNNAYVGEGGVAERYWLLSNGAYLIVDDDAPLFLSINTTDSNRLCITARDQQPYTKRSPLTFAYNWCVAPNVKQAQLQAISNFLGKPEALPDTRMLVQPLWSTWAEYKREVNQTLVLSFAKRIFDEGFTNTSHIEIDDDWETCYGELEWNLEKFPNPKEMIDEIHEMGLRVTLWAHPLVNVECPKFREGLENGHFVKDAKGRTGITSWWVGENSGILDSTNPEAIEWWSDRLRNIMAQTGVDSWKFDAGEVNLLPASPVMAGEERFWPKIYTKMFVDACAEFGGLVETRTASGNQAKPKFTRMDDKDSKWEYENGLRSLIPTALLLGVSGYPFILPDMIGGNNYFGEELGQELYVRWMQVNIFMPGMQFSIVPWRIGRDEEEKRETVRMCLEVLKIREKYADRILDAARQAVADGSPINRALWWVDPTDQETYTIDDEYMMGDSILVAPVTYEGQTSRDIYLPSGTWVDEQTSSVHNGPVWLRDYPAPISVVPIFVKVD